MFSSDAMLRTGPVPGSDRPPPAGAEMKASSTIQNNVPAWLLGSIFCVVLWAYWNSLSHLMGRWSREPEYSHGFFVPLVSIGLLWLQRDRFKSTWQGSWYGIALIALGIALRVLSALEFYTLIGALAILPTLAGVAMLVGGWPCLRWALPSILFLGFMIPLPGFVSELLAQPLQRIATVSSLYLLQLLGIAATNEGNVIVLTTGKIGVVEACSGLRMMILFFSVSTAVALLVQRSLVERILIIVSAAPIALCVNIVRITVTGLFHEWVGAEFASAFFHDIAGWLMGPAALALLFLEIKFFDSATIAVPEGPLVGILGSKAGR